MLRWTRAARKSTHREKLIAASIQWAERIMEKIDGGTDGARQ